MKESTMNLFTIMRSIRRLRSASDSTFQRSMASAAAAEAAGTDLGAIRSVSFFEDVTGRYAEVIVGGGYELSCGMCLCCMVDMESLEVCGMIGVDSPAAYLENTVETSA